MPMQMGIARVASKLLDLYYAGKISADGFQEAEQRLCEAIEELRQDAVEDRTQERVNNDLEVRFDESGQRSWKDLT